MFQNIPNYLTLFLGILIAGALVVFSIMFEPLIDDYASITTPTSFFGTPVAIDTSLMISALVMLFLL